MSTTLLLRNLRIVSAGVDRRADLRIRRHVVEIAPGLAARRGERALDLSGRLALPGLINAHDHLDLDLLPRLGQPPYGNVYEWAAAVYRPDEPPVAQHRRVPLADRLLWGALRNLVAGVTTVMHHDPYHRRIFRRSFPIRVIERYAWAHSLGFSTDLARRFARSAGRPFVVHAAEGTDERARQEIARLDELGVLSPHTVLVHGIALGAAEIERLVRRRVALVWCPASNRWLYGATMPLREIAGRLPVALGSDSTISGSPTLLEELRTAAATGLATPDELLEMVTTCPAAIFGLDDGRGRLVEGGAADLLVLPDDGGSSAKQLLRARPGEPELVLCDGRPQLASPQLAVELGLGEPAMSVGGVHRWCAVDVGTLRQRITAAAGGEGAFVANPVWQLMADCRGSDS